MRFPDLTAVWRSLRRSPGYVVASVSMLALAVASLTAILSAVRTVVLDPLPVRDPGRIVLAWQTDPARSLDVVEVSYRNYRDWLQTNRTFDQLAVMGSSNWPSVLETGDEPVRLSSTAVSANFFDLLGAAPVLGRSLRPEDDTASAPGVVVLSHEGWVRHFGADAGVIGRLITLDDERHEVVGVMAPDLNLPAGVDYWTPIAPVLASVSKGWKIDAFEMRGLGLLYVVGRLKSRASVDSAASDLDRIVRQLPEAPPLAASTPAAVVTPLLNFAIGPVRVVLWWLAGLALVVLTIVCVNVSGLMLARATLRRGEDAVRLSLGASRGRLARLWWLEATLLGSAGASLGLIGSIWLTRTVLALAPADIPRLDRVRVDVVAAAVSAIAGLGASWLCAVLPALQTLRVTTSDVTREAVRATSSRRVQRARAALVWLEVTLAVVLLLATGLTVRSFLKLRQIDPGFRTAGVLTMQVEPHASPESTGVFYRTFLERVRGERAVVAAGAVYLKPLALGPIGTESSVRLEGQPDTPTTWQRNPFVNYEVVTPGYFEAMGTRIVSGRTFTDEDNEKAPRVAIVGESAARRLWPGKNAVGQRLAIPRLSDKGPPRWRTIVGVVQDVRYRGLDDPRLDYYEPAAQANQLPKDIIIRTTLPNPLALASVVEAHARSLDPRVLVGNVETLEDVVIRAQAPWRFTAAMFTGFGIVAFVLAVGGLFSVIALSVAERHRELALRAVLGAEPRDVRRHVLGQSLRLAVPGVACGAIAGAVCSRWLRSLLFEVGTLDAAVYVGVPALVIAIMLAATWIPARHASRTDPASLLRH